MLVEQIRQEAKKFFENANGSHDWDHTERVYGLCMHIGEKENANIEVLKLAVLLHDIGREDEVKSQGKICHAERSAALAREILSKYNVNALMIEQIAHCIECHRIQKNQIPDSTEAKVLFDADKLDAIGAVGVGRLFMYAGNINSRLHNKNVDLKESKDYTREDTAYRYFLLHSVKIKDRLFTQEGKRIAEERFKFMSDFFDKINEEVDGES